MRICQHCGKFLDPGHACPKCSERTAPSPSDETASAGCMTRLVRPLQIGDSLPLHKYSGQNIPLERLTLWFYHAHCREDAEEIEQLEMAIEEIIQTKDQVEKRRQ